MAELTPQHTPLYNDRADHPTRLTGSDESVSVEATFKRTQAKRRAEVDVGNGRGAQCPSIRECVRRDRRRSPDLAASWDRSDVGPGLPAGFRLPITSNVTLANAILNGCNVVGRATFRPGKPGPTSLAFPLPRFTDASIARDDSFGPPNSVTGSVCPSPASRGRTTQRVASQSLQIE